MVTQLHPDEQTLFNAETEIIQVDYFVFTLNVVQRRNGDHRFRTYARLAFQFPPASHLILLLADWRRARMKMNPTMTFRVSKSDLVSGRADTGSLASSIFFVVPVVLVSNQKTAVIK